MLARCLIAVIAATGICNTALAQPNVQQRMDTARQYYNECLAAGACSAQPTGYDPAGEFLSQAFADFLRNRLAIPSSRPVETLWDRPDVSFVRPDGTFYFTIGEFSSPKRAIDEARRWIAANDYPMALVVRRTGAQYAIVIDFTQDSTGAENIAILKEHFTAPPAEFSTFRGNDVTDVVWANPFSFGFFEQAWKQSGFRFHRWHTRLPTGAKSIVMFSRPDADLSPTGTFTGRNEPFMGVDCSADPFGRGVTWCLGVLQGSDGYYVGHVDARHLRR